MPKKNPYFISWSGGKDSCLSLSRAIKKYGKPSCLLNMLTEDGFRSRSHGLSKTVLERQAHLLGVPIYFHATSWDNYEITFLNALHEFKRAGIEIGVFGDIKIPDNPNWNSHRQWADNICKKAGISAFEPLWDDDIESILQELFEDGFKAKIISVKADHLSPDYLGKVLDKDLIVELTKQGINPAGEQGEYHTIVIDGPLFSSPMCLRENGRVLRDGYWFLDVYCDN